MGEEQHAFRQGWPEARQKVAQVQHVAATGDVRKCLNHDGVGIGAQLSEDPVTRPLVPRRPGDPGPERQLLLEEAKSPLPIELAPARPSPGRAGEQHGRDGDAQHPGHRICPTLVDRFTNAVITSCAVL